MSDSQTLHNATSVEWWGFNPKHIDLGKEKPSMGEVVAAGKGRLSEFGKFIGTTVQVGDTVVVPNFGAQKVFVEGEEYLVCREQDIMCVIKETKQEDDK